MVNGLKIFLKFTKQPSERLVNMMKMTGRLIYADPNVTCNHYSTFYVKRKTPEAGPKILMILFQGESDST